MKREFHAQYDLLAHDDLTQGQAVDYLTGVSDSSPRKWAELAQAEDPATRLSLLAQALASPYKNRARMGQQRGTPGGLWRWIASGEANMFLAGQREHYLQPLNLLPSLLDLTSFPRYSFAFHFTFILRKSYLSRDDTDWHILDNPLKKEWVFKLPYVASTQWKGALRAAMMQQLVERLTTAEMSFTEERLQLYRLFGSEKDGAADFLNRALACWRVGLLPENADDPCQKEREERIKAEVEKMAQEFDALLRKRGYRQEDVEGFQGRLYFYPTYFDQIGLEVLNPHPRDTGAGKQPIYFECVPAGAPGAFTLLYVPFGPLEQDEDQKRAEVAEDLRLLAQGLQAMLTTYGFGAKTSSGFGVAEDRLAGEGKLAIRAELAAKETSPAAPPEPQRPDLPRYLETPTRLHADLRHPDGSLISEAEYQAFIENKGQKY
ncbi:MAG: hypothetical protein GYA30_09370, partial [Chloroflexi bacterium]|nr:hypothetical protein [Chloroflexota bacterium]